MKNSVKNFQQFSRPGAVGPLKVPGMLREDENLKILIVCL